MKIVQTQTKTHAAQLKRVQEQVRSFYRQRKQVKIYRGSTNSLRKQDFRKDEVVDVSDLNDILKIDRQKQTVVTEPNVPMDELVNHTLQHGFIPAVVMEFPGITVGGGVQGGAAESSSFKYGAFHDTCLEYEIVLGNGEIIRASRQKNNELFREIACAYGTLGVLTKITLRLVPAAKYVHLSYIVVRSFKEARSVLVAQSKKRQEIDFIDGIMFSKDLGVVMTGKLSRDEPSLPKASFHRFRDEWFYLHAEKITRRGRPHQELIPIKDYLFRYDRGAFWMARYAFSFTHVPFTRLTRIALSPLCTTRYLYRQLHNANLSQRYFVQDLCVPQDKVVEFMEFVDTEIGSYPLWLLPMDPSLSLTSVFVPTKHMRDVVIDVGVWSEVKDYERFLQLNRETEAKVQRLGGVKTLYAHAYYTKEEFWSIYDKPTYDKLRKKYHADRTFPDIYSKVIVTERYTPSIKNVLRHFFRFKFPLSK